MAVVPFPNTSLVRYVDTTLYDAEVETWYTVTIIYTVSRKPSGIEYSIDWYTLDDEIRSRAELVQQFGEKPIKQLERRIE